MKTLQRTIDRRLFLGALTLPLVARAALPGTTGRSDSAHDYSVRDFGARGDGQTNDTASIQAAIDQCSQTGGRLVFPPGEYRTGMVRLKSHVTIELRNQAVWRAIPDVTLYPKVVEGLPPAFLYAEEAEDLHLIGEGKIHGSGDSHEAFIAGREQTLGPRPFGLLLIRCRNVSLIGITLENSAYWMFRPQECDDVVIRGVKVVNHANFNNDGFDICDCHRVVISDCILDCEDDAICLKSHAERGVVDVVVSNCIVSSHASALKFGTASFGCFKRIAVANCVVRPSRFRKTLHPAQMVDGITGIDLVTSDGATLTNVSFDNIVIDGPLTAFFLRLGNRHAQHWPRLGEKADSEAAGRIDGVSLSNIRAFNTGPVACSISGYPEHYVTDIRLTNINIALRASGTAEDLDAAVPENSRQYPSTRMFRANLPACGLFLRHVKNISVDGLHLRPAENEPRSEVVAEDVHGLMLSRLTTTHAQREKPRVKISQSTRVSISGDIERIG